MTEPCLSCEGLGYLREIGESCRCPACRGRKKIKYASTARIYRILSFYISLARGYKSVIGQHRLDLYGPKLRDASTHDN